VPRETAGPYDESQVRADVYTYEVVTVVGDDGAVLYQR